MAWELFAERLPWLCGGGSSKWSERSDDRRTPSGWPEPEIDETKPSKWGTFESDEDGNFQWDPATKATRGTFVVVADPMTAVRLGATEAPPTDGFFAIGLERLTVDPSGFGFPLPEEFGPYLCTQGVGGHLTHFFPESYHAIDFRCANHTPVLSIGDGVVKEIAESHKCGGIHAAHLAVWNSISVLLASGIVVEYLHTLPGSARVKVGEEVRRGQVLCESGDIGFAPEPRLGANLRRSAQWADFASCGGRVR
ncbi:unnamed protein product [Effrenium voratum]|nr:unnamed protein product [Effrenium voratum]